ncbi:MAG: tRNA (adenosine(37)-N6)-threonylcarbamoyltransferase complex transferase subunit TsaD [Pseudomonadota bacterium]
MTVLGIETSCDETAAAVIELSDAGPRILSEMVRGQVEEHTPYGGVVPEIAARAHVELADHIIAQTLADAGIAPGALSGVAATTGPGLIGGVMVGMMTGKAIALVTDKPFIPINHLEGHALSPRLSQHCPFPYLLLLVSGGHCQFLAVRGVGAYTRLGSTIDDAAGEAFDKLARTLDLGFPGGPAVESLAHHGQADRFDLPRPLLNRPDLNFSFAGLKTAAARIALDNSLDDKGKADLCAGFQAAVADCLEAKSERAIDVFRDSVDPDGTLRFVVAGGVAANQTIRTKLDALCQRSSAKLIAPPLRHCTDNAAMIALAGAERLRAALVPEDGLAFTARSRWPLDEVRAQQDPMYGAGKRGAKA